MSSNPARLTLATWFQSRSCGSTLRPAQTGHRWTTGTVSLLLDDLCFVLLDVDLLSPTVAEANGCYKWKLPVTTWETPNPTEDWDQGTISTTGSFVAVLRTPLTFGLFSPPEADDHGPVFVLGKKVESAAK